MRAFFIAAAVIGIVAAAADVGFSQAKPSATPIEGAWKGVSVVATGAGASTNPNRQPNILIYTKKHYSIVSQDAARPLPPRKAVAPPKDPNKLTDAEKLALYGLWAPINAQSGTYEVKGTTLVHNQIVAKTIPVVNTLQLEFKDNNNTMVTVAKSLPGEPVGEIRRTFTRLE